AEDAFKAALQARPDDDGATEALSQLELVRDNWQKVLAKYVAEAKGATDKALAASLHVSIAELCWKREPGSPEVDENLRKALTLDPRNRRAAVHLERHLRKAERFADLAAFYEQREATAAVPKDEKLAALIALADLQREKLHRADLAA